MKQQLLRFKSAIIRNNEMWCVPTVLNWIFRINLNDWSVKSVCDLKLDVEIPIEYIFECENSIWCISSVGARIVEYCIETGAVKHYEMDTEKQRNRGVLFFDKKIWMLPIELPGNVICFDIDKKKFAFHDKWKRECILRKLNGKTMSFYHDGKMVYMTLRDECKILRFNLENGEMKIKRLPGKSGLRCILKSHDDFYITSFKNRMLFRWNIKTEEIKIFYPQYLEKGRYVRALEFKNKVLLIDGKRIECYEKDTGRICAYDKIPGELKNDYEKNSLYPLFFDVLKYENRWFMIPWHANMLLEYTEGNEDWEGHILEIPVKLYYKEYVLKKLKQYYIIGEDEIRLSDYIKYIETSQDIKEKDRTKELLGCQIYCHLSID